MIGIGLDIPTSAVLGRAGGSAPSPVPPYPTLTGEYFRTSADNPANTSTTVVQTFAPSDIDTTNHKILMSDIGFDAWISFSSQGGTPGHFTTTGTLPTEIADASKDYYLKRVTGGYEVYLGSTDADYAILPGVLQGDKVYPAQNWTQSAQKITFSGQGAGIHTFVTKAEALVSVISNLVAGKNYTSQAASLTNKHAFAEVFSDGSGKKYFRSRRLAQTTLEGPSHGSFGKGFAQSGSAGKLAARQEVEGKRTLVYSAVIYAEQSTLRNTARATIGSANVNTTTGVLTLPAGAGVPTTAFLTAEPGQVRAIGSATLPTGFDAVTTYYIRSVSSTTFTLHPTATDATNNTNVIIPTTQGSGQFQFWQSGVWGDSERQRFLSEILDPASGGNAITLGYDRLSAGDATIRPGDITISGTSSGDMGATGRNSRAMGEAAQITVLFPPGTTPPIRQDTGLPLAEGTYWQSLKPSSSVGFRLHDTQAAAIAAATIPTSALTGPNNCIRFNNVPVVGQMRIRAAVRSFSPGLVRGTELATFSPPQQTKGILTVLVDYNDPAATNIHIKVFWNNAKVADYELASGAKGNTGTALNDGTPAWTDDNSAASHVTFEGRKYFQSRQASTGAIAESEIIGSSGTSLHEWAKAQYGIA